MDLLQRMWNAIRERFPLGNLLSSLFFELSYAVTFVLLVFRPFCQISVVIFRDFFTSIIPLYFLKFTSAVHFKFLNLCYVNNYIPQVCNKHEIILCVSDMPYITIYNKPWFIHSPRRRMSLYLNLWYTCMHNLGLVIPAVQSKERWFRFLAILQSCTWLLYSSMLSWHFR